MSARNSLFTKILPCLAVLAIGDTVVAENNYPGLMCSAVSGVVSPDTNGHVQNNSSTTTATVMCPAVVNHDTSGVDPDGKPFAFVTDQNFDTNVCCSSRVKNAGQSVVSGGNACSSGTNSGSQTLAMTNPSTPGGNFTFTHRWIQCTVPPTFNGVASEVRTYMY